VLAHSVRVDLETDGVVDGLEEGLAAVGEVEDGEDSATSDEGALFGIGNMHNVDVVVAVDLKLGVDVVPLLSGWEVDLDLGGGTVDGVLNAWVANLWADENVRSEHELMVQVEGHLVLGELVPHGTHDRQTSVGGLEEQVVHVVALSVSLLDSSKSGTLDAW